MISFFIVLDVYVELKCRRLVSKSISENGEAIRKLDDDDVTGNLKEIN